MLLNSWKVVLGFIEADFCNQVKANGLFCCITFFDLQTLVPMDSSVETTQNAFSKRHRSNVELAHHKVEKYIWFAN